MKATHKGVGTYNLMQSALFFSILNELGNPHWWRVASRSIFNPVNIWRRPSPNQRRVVLPSGTRLSIYCKLPRLVCTHSTEAQQQYGNCCWAGFPDSVLVHKSSHWPFFARVAYLFAHRDISKWKCVGIICTQLLKLWKLLAFCLLSFWKTYWELEIWQMSESYSWLDYSTFIWRLMHNNNSHDYYYVYVYTI